MSFDELLSTPRAVDIEFSDVQVPEAWKAGIERRPDGSATIVTRPLTEATEDAVAAYLEEHGFPREHYMLKPGTGILSKQWTALKREWNPDLGEKGEHETVVQELSSSRVEVVPRTRKVDIEELVQAAGEMDPAHPRPATAIIEGAFGLALGDLQLGKVDGDGPEGTVRRFKACVLAAVREFERSGKGWAHIAFLGDCLEGMVSQGGKNAWRTCLTTTEQVRLLRRLMLWLVDQFVNAGAAKITVVSVPGNHDEAQREPVSTRVDDSWAIEALVSLQDAMEMNPERYSHVQCYVPGPDEADVTMEVAGFPITHNHGHLYSKADRVKSAFDWLKGMKFSGSPQGYAKLMLAGHGHNFQSAEENGVMWCMVPALEKLSVWWYHKTGTKGTPGVVTFIIEDGELVQLSRRKAPKE